MTEWPWDELGIDETRDLKVIRSAYSERLKELDLDKQIEEYSRLREARAFAFHLAQQPEEDKEDFGLGNPTQDWEEAEGQAPLHYEGNGSVEPSMQSVDQDLVSSEDAPATDPEAEAVTQRFNAIAQIVLPNGEPSDEGFSVEENEEARALLREMCDIASNADLDLYQGLDFHLSEILAMGWPRSAPLVEDANAAFNWFAEVGQITERPALVFLNARLAGMRFHQEVEMPGHRFHKAWNDLLHGGAPVWIKRWWLSRDTVVDLINLIRVEHPELEALLQATRIQAWENATNSGFARVIQFIAVAWFISSALRFCAAELSSSGSDLMTEHDQASEAVYQGVIVELLGEDWNATSLQLANPILADFFEKSVRVYRDLEGKPSVEAALDDARHGARLVLMDERNRLDFDGQVRAHQLLLTWLTMARAEGKPECKAMLNGVDYTPKLSPNVDATATYEEERLLLNILLNQGGSRLPEPETIEERSVSVPGAIIGEMIENSQLSEEQIRDGLTRLDSEARCDVTIALMEAVAREPGNAPVELLAVP